MDSEDEAALLRVENMIAGALRRRADRLVEKVAIGPKAVGWKLSQ
jgi:hypothetical protein